MSFDWIVRANQRATVEPPPRAGKGATTKAWRKHAEDLGYDVAPGAGRDTIIALVDAGPPPTPPTARTPKLEGDVYAATKAAVEAAHHLTALDQPAVAVLLDLAKTIDGFDQRPPNGPLDNVTVPIFLRYSESLGLTPASRAKLDVKQPKPESALDRARQRWGASGG